MFIHRADTGVIYSVDATPDTSVEQLKEALAKISSIPTGNQILLCDGIKLERGQKLQFYGMPSQDKGLFLFDRKMLEPDSPIPGDVVLPPVELQIKPLPPLPSGEELERSPLVWSLIKFENEFLGDLNTAEALKQVVDARVNICKSLVSEQENQVKALDAAIANLNEQYNQILQAYGGFKTYYMQLHERHRGFLQSFESDMQKLREIRLHSALMKEGMTTLKDFVPEARLRKWADECGREHEQLMLRVGELEKQVVNVKDYVELENRKSPDVDFKTLHLQLKKAYDIASEVALRAQVFLSDYAGVKDRKDQALQKESGQSLWGLSDGLDDIKRIHQRYLQSMDKHDEAMKSIMVFCANSKTKLTRNIHERLCNVASLQSKIRDVANKVIVFHEGLSRQKSAFQQLVYVQSMPRAYQAALEEVGRRRKFIKKLGGITTKITDVLSKLRQDEYEKRKSFLESYGRYIPKDLIPGLSDALPPFDLNISPFDTTLPLIETELTMEEEDFTIVLSDDKPNRLQDLELENQKLLGELKTLKSDLGNSRNNDLRESDLVYRLKSDLLQSQESATDYKKRIEALEVKLSTTYSQVEQAESLVKQFKDKYEHAEVQLERIQAEASQLLQSQAATEQIEVNLIQTRRDLETMSTKWKDSEKEKEGLVRKLQEYEREKDTLSRQLRELTLQKEEFSAQLLESSNVRESLRNTVKAFETDNGCLRDKLQEKEKENEKYRAQLHDYESLEVQLQRAEIDKQQLMQRLQIAEKEGTEVSSKWQDSQTKIQDLSEHLQSLENENESLTNKLQSIEQQFKSLEKERDDTQRKWLEDRLRVSSEFEETIKTNDTLLLESQNLVREYEERIANYDSQVEQLQTQYSEKQNAFEKLDTAFEDLKRLHREKTSSLQSQIGQLTSEKTNSQNKIEKLSEALSQSLQQIQQLEANLLQKEEQLRKLAENLSVDKQQQKAVEELSTSYKRKIKELEDRITRDQKKLDDFTADVEFYKLRSNKVEEEKKQLNESLSQAFQRANKAEEEKLTSVRQMTENLTKTNGSIKRLEEEKKRLALLCAELGDKCEKLEGEKKLITTELSSVKEKNAIMQQDLQNQIILNERSAKALEMFSKQASGDSSEKLFELEKQLGEKELELQKTANSFKLLSQKYIDAVKQLDLKNKQNSEIMKASTLQERKILTVEEEKNGLKANVEKHAIQLSSVEKELQRVKDTLKGLENTLPKDPFRRQADDPLVSIQEAVRKLIENNILLDRQEKEAVDRMKAIEFALEHSREESSKKVQELQSTITALEMEMESKDVKPNISFSNFKPGEFAMFIPDKNGHYEACNKNSPHYYLSPFVLENFEKESKQKAPIFGQIVEIQPNKASISSNPFSLALGTPYYEVIITSNYF